MSMLIENADAMEGFGEKIALSTEPGTVLYLVGNLGAGKTTLVRGFLRGLGHTGKVKSPTYTLIEAYSLAEKNIYHFDLYRINDSEELESMGIRDYFDGLSICLFEWPERGASILPKADIVIDIDYAEKGRTISLDVKSDKGQSIFNQL